MGPQESSCVPFWSCVLEPQKWVRLGTLSSGGLQIYGGLRHGHKQPQPRD